MSALEWTEGNLHTLGRKYLREVLTNMRNEKSHVQFGETGQGIAPNYQTIFENGRIIPRRGLSHEAFDQDQAEEFNLSRISKPFSYSDVNAAFEKAPKK